MALTLRNTKGSPLTYTEVDKNFTWINDKVISVKDYGAVGDGVTDDTAAINTAIASGAKSIMFPAGTGAGTYIIGSELQVYGSDLTLWSNDGATIQHIGAVAVGFGAVRLRGSRVTFRGLTFDGNNSSPALSGDNAGVSLDTNSGTIDGVTFERCKFQNFNGYGVYAFNAGTLKNVLFSGCEWASFTNTAPTPKGAVQIVQPVTSYVRAEGCVWRDVTGVCFGVRSNAGSDVAEQITVTGCNFSNNGSTYTSLGVEVWNARNLSVSGNTFHNGRMGVSVTGEQVAIAGNSFTDLTSYCCEASSTNGLTFTGNVCENFTYGVIAYNGLNDLAIVGNTFRTSQAGTGAGTNDGWALHLSGSPAVTDNFNRITFAANTLYDCAGVRIDRATDITIVGNTFETPAGGRQCLVNTNNVLTSGVRIAANTFRTAIDLSASSGLIVIAGSAIHIDGNSVISTTGSPNTGVGIVNAGGTTLTDVTVRDNYLENWNQGVNMNSGSPTATNVHVGPNTYKTCTTTAVVPNSGAKFDFISGGYSEFGDVDATLRANNNEHARFTVALTANRTITLDTASAYRGQRFRVTRSAGDTGGPWTLSVGGLKSLSASQWCEVVYNGSAWVLTAYGTL